MLKISVENKNSTHYAKSLKIFKDRQVPSSVSQLVELVETGDQRVSSLRLTAGVVTVLCP